MKKSLPAFLTALALVLGFGAPSHATPLTLDFADQDCSDDDTGIGKVGPITFTNPNIFLYNNCQPAIVIGDDGFSSDAEIFADPGVLFDLIQFDLSGFHDILRIPYDPLLSDWETDEAFAQNGEIVRQFNYLRLIGLDDNGVVATDEFDPTGLSVYRSDGRFDNINRLIFSLTITGYSYLLQGDYLYGCPPFSCGFVQYDNVVLNVASQVPLPASLPLAMLALAGLGALGRRRRS